MFRDKKKDAAPVAKKVDGDDLGRFPTDTDNNPTRQRVLERALRLMTIGLGASALINVALTAMIIAIFPLKQVYPYLVTFRESDDQVVALEPISAEAPGIQFATEANVRQYVKLRHSFFPVNTIMDAQWGPDSQLAAMTEMQEFKDFENSSNLERARMMTSGYTRQIDIESATMIRPDTWQVAFQTVDTLGGSGGTLTTDPTVAMADSRPDGMQNVSASAVPAASTKTWIATMTIDYQPQQVSYDKRLLNPLGFTVTDYSVTARN